MRSKVGLPPEDRLPRRVVRDRAAPGGESRLSQRDRQRALRREHEQLLLEIEALDRHECDLRGKIDTQFEDMAVLTLWRAKQEGEQPLTVEVTMTAFMSAGIVIDERIAVDGVGAAFSVGGTVLVDAGRAAYLLSRRKGWRDLSLTDPDGMPIPVPPEPARVSLNVSGVSGQRSRIEGMGKGNVLRSAREILKAVRTADPESRTAMLAKVAAWGNWRLERLVADLISYTGEPKDDRPLRSRCACICLFRCRPRQMDRGTRLL